MIYYLYTGILLLMSSWVVWRFYSQRHVLPCPSWLAWMVELDNPFAKAHKATEIIRFLSLRPGMKILDIGCGPGRICVPLAEKIDAIGGHVTGLDIQSDMIEKAREKSEKLGLLNIDFICGTIDQLPDNTYYNSMLMVCVLGEIPATEHAKVLEKMSSHLVPEGIISVTETVFDPHFQRHAKVKKLMKNNGFAEIKYRGNWLAYTAHFRKE
ncbi:class I SAM-dependent methyltransferase [bacterium]|nr:MAG: class I SAM-dependent methyltransferase [bacterium]QQR62197.1 MAG: class I SAM-dependent methyltransferase [bacterium]QQR63245.1 MAG: class I SAM-dependent methyltransferase [bacterium]